MLVRLSIIIIIRHLGFILKKIALELVSKSEEGVGYRYFFFRLQRRRALSNSELFNNMSLISR